MPENETYQVVATCVNCGQTPKEKTTNDTIIGPLKYNIPKGIRVGDFLSRQVCPNCGCQGHLKRHHSL